MRLNKTSGEAIEINTTASSKVGKMVSEWVKSNLEENSLVNWESISKEIQSFIKIAEKEWIIDIIHAINFYCIEPNYLQKEILINWFHDQNEIFLEEHKIFLKSILEKVAKDRYSHYTIDENVYWISEDKLVSTHLYTHIPGIYNYSIIKNIRYYFSILSELYDLLDNNEKEKAKDYFIDFHKKLSLWYDIWEINIKNSCLYKNFLRGLYSAYENDKKIFIESCKKHTILTGDSYRIFEKIPLEHAKVIENKKQETLALWTGRCKRLLLETWIS